MSEQIIPERNQPSLSNRSECLETYLQSNNPHEKLKHTCRAAKLFGFTFISMRFSPTPIAPELTRTTL